jgi:hypothetical protein
VAWSRAHDVIGLPATGPPNVPKLEGVLQSSIEEVPSLCKQSGRTKGV